MPAPSNPKVFLKAATGNGYYTTRGATLKSHYLEQLLVQAEAATMNGAGDADALAKGTVPIELSLPDTPAKELVMVMGSCERMDGVATRGKPTAEEAAAADRKLIDGLELEPLLRLVGVSHRLGVMPLLNLGAARVAGLLTEAAGSTSERAGVPFDAYLRRDEADALDSELETASTEFIFTLPDASGEPPAMPGVLRLHQYDGAVPEPSSESATNAAGAYGAAGTGSAGASGRAAGGVAEGADQLVELLGGEAPLHSVLVLLSAATLQALKPHGHRWRRRARAALCSGQWAEHARGATSVLDLGATRHWQAAERCVVARFLADGRFARLLSLRADGFEASLQPLLQLERADAAALLRALTVNPHVSADGGFPSADALCAQSEFCALVALWLFGSSHALRSADFKSITFAGLLPLSSAVAPAVELASRRSLESLVVSKATLPVRDLVGLPPPPPPVGAPVGAALRTAPAASVELKWKGLSALDAVLIGSLLRANRSLTRLDLSWNSELSTAGSSGAVDLAEAIAASPRLRDVDLSETNLGADPRCAAAMCRCVAQNPNLTRFNVRSCGLNAEARKRLEEAAARRTAPLELLIEYER